MTLPFTPNDHNDLTDVFWAIADIANNGGNGASALTSVDSDFQAFDRMPGGTTLPYPFMFPLLRQWTIEDRAMGADVTKPFKPVVSVLILVGRSSNDFGALSYEASRYVMPFYALFMANRSLRGTVQNIAFYDPLEGQREPGTQGDIALNAVTHYGLELPLYITQRQPMHSQK